MPQITRKAAGDCQGKDCPAVWDTTDPQMVGIQGDLPQAGEMAQAGDMPGREGIVFVPRSLLDAWASAQR